jgi:hypothetical protein
LLARKPCLWSEHLIRYIYLIDHASRHTRCISSESNTLCSRVYAYMCCRYRTVLHCTFSASCTYCPSSQSDTYLPLSFSRWSHQGPGTDECHIYCHHFYLCHFIQPDRFFIPPAKSPRHKPVLSHAASPKSHSILSTAVRFPPVWSQSRSSRPSRSPTSTRKHANSMHIISRTVQSSLFASPRSRGRMARYIGSTLVHVVAVCYKV